MKDTYYQAIIIGKGVQTFENLFAFNTNEANTDFVNEQCICLNSSNEFIVDR